MRENLNTDYNDLEETPPLNPGDDQDEEKFVSTFMDPIDKKNCASRQPTE